MRYLVKSVLVGFIVFLATESPFDAVAWGLLHPVVFHLLKWVSLGLFAHTHSMK